MKHRSTYENIRAAVQDLTLCEKYIVYYLAFADNASKYALQDIGRDCRNIKIAEINLAIKNLLKNGFIKNKSQYHYSEKYSLDGLRRLELAMNLFRFESIGVRTDIGGIRYSWGLDLNHTKLWKCAELLSQNDTFGLKDLFRRYPNELSSIVIANVGGKDAADLYKAVPEEYIMDLTSNIIVRLYNSNKYGEGTTLQSVEGIFLEWVLENNIQKKTIDPVLDMIHAHKFIYEGVPFSAKDPDGCYAILVDAVKSLYARKTEEAVSRFAAAMRILNKRQELKNVIYEPTFCFLMIMALKLSSNSASKAKIETFLRKNTENAICYLYPATFAAEYIDTIEKDRGAENLKHFHDRMRPFERAGYQFEALFSYYMKTGSPQTSLSMVGDKPLIAILRHELSCWDSENGKDFSEIFGGRPLFMDMKGKSTWELQLENLKTFIAKASKGSGKEAGSDNRSSRLAYLIDRDRIEVREQTRLKNGNWGKGKKVSFEAFVSGKVECADDFDKSVMIAAKNTAYSFRQMDLSSMISSLIGCDRVFLEDSMLPVDIQEDKLFLSITKDKNGLLLDSNVQKSYLELGYKTFYSSSKDKRKYKVITVSKEQSALLVYLLGIRRFPLEAEASLKEILPTLGGVVEIHSDLIEGGSSLEKKEGDPTVIIRIKPENDHFSVNVFVHPLEGGAFTSIPGEGQKVIFDQADGVRYQVTRKTKAEAEAYSDLCDFCFDDIGISPTAEGEMELFPNEVLSILDNFGKDERFALEWPEGKQLKIKGALGTSSFKMSLHSRESWFDVEGDVNVNGESIPVATIMALLGGSMVGTNFIRLSESEYLKISDSLRKQLQRLESLTVSSRGKSSISVFKVGQVAEILRSSSLDIKVDSAFTDLVKKIEASSALSFDVPKELNATLRDYQIEGFEWISRLDSWGGGACLADDMGLGKTVQAIAFMLMKKDLGPSIVVSPASVILNWKNEISKFAPTLNVTVLNTATDRKKAIQESGPSDIILCTYGLMVTESEAISAKSWNVACLDEAHTIKNRDTKMSAAAMKISCSSRLILTGTPVQNYLGELWNLFQFLNPGLLGSFEQFHSKFIYPIEAGDKERSGQLKRIIQPFILRRTKAEVVDELPDKTDIVRTVEFSPEETFFYEALRKKAEESLASADKVNVNALAQITMLREAACSASLLKKDWNGAQSKIDTLMEMIPEILSGGNSLLVFSQFTSFLNLCRAELDKAGIDYFYLEGSTTIKKREEMVQDFQSGKKKLFLISLKAGGLGLNLTGANYVIHMDPWWNPAVEQQATDRAYRIGQKQKVTVYHLITQHTIEEKITRLHKFKKDMADAILEGTNVSHALTMDDLRELVK